MKEISILYIFILRKKIVFFFENIFYQEYNLNLLKLKKMNIPWRINSFFLIIRF